MGNPRSFTTNLNARRQELEAFVKSKAGKSMTKRKAAMERAITLPNRLDPLPRAAEKTIVGSVKS
jgi:hypothetical protein